jgi:hypothetical protein
MEISWTWQWSVLAIAGFVILNLYIDRLNTNSRLKTILTMKDWRQS